MEKGSIGRVAEVSDSKNRNIAKLQTDYVLQHEESQISVARKKRLLYRRLTVFFIFVAIITYLMISTLISQNSTLADKKIEKEQAQQELSSLKKEEILLKDEIVKLNDDDYIGKLARKEYFLSDENEIIFTLPEKKDKEKEEKEKSPK
jgi:cell division protein DivIC